MAQEHASWIAKLGSADFNERWDAIMHFIECPHEQAVESLARLATNPEREEDEQHYAAEAVLRTVGEDAYVERFGRAFQELESPRDRLALSALAEWAPEASREVMLEALESGNPRSVSLALGTLGRLEDLTLAGTIRPFLEHDTSRIRRAAFRAISRLESDVASRHAIADLESDDVDKRFDAVIQLKEQPSRLAVEPLIARLQEPDEEPKVRYNAVEALGATRDPRAFEPVLEALDDPLAPVRSRAAQYAGYFGDERAIEPLSDYLHAREDDESAHSEAAAGLGHLRHSDAIPTLVDALEDDRAEVRKSASGALHKIDPPHHLRQTVIDGLRARLEDPETVVRKNAIQGLGILGADEATDDIAEFLSSDEQGERWRALGALGALKAAEYADDIIALRDDTSFVMKSVPRALAKIGRPKDLSVLIAMLDDVPKEAANALAEFGDPAAIDALVEHADELVGTQDEYARVHVLGAAAALGHAPSADALAAILAAGGKQAKYAAIYLTRAGDERGLDECSRQVQSNYWNVIHLAIAALAEYGGEVTRPALEIALEDPRADVHAAAKSALEALHSE